MKKIVILFSIISIPINVFASDFSQGNFSRGSFSPSAGGGGLLGYTFTRYSLKGGNMESSQSMDRFDFAGLLFIDAVYAEFSVMYKSTRSSYSENMIYDTSSLTDSTGTGAETSIGFTLFGKYPFTINEKFVFFPIFGIEYQIALKQTRHPDGDFVYNRTKGQLIEDRDKDNKPYKLSAWNSMWIDVGAGLDYNFAGALFLRSELIFDFRLPTAYELGALEVVKNPPMNIQNPKLAGLTGGPSIKIGMGYRFKTHKT